MRHEGGEVQVVTSQVRLAVRGPLPRILLLLALLPFGSPLSAQRVGVVYLNFGPVTRETARHVRSGNMGNDWAFRLETGERWTVGGTYAPTHLYVWPRSGEISRWSFRPEGTIQTTSFSWLSIDAGYRFSGSVLSVEPGVAVWVPMATDYARWGAQMGFAPASTVEVAVHVGPTAVACRGSAVYQRPHTWVVFSQFSQAGAPLRSFWSFPVSCGLEAGR